MLSVATFPFEQNQEKTRALLERLCAPVGSGLPLPHLLMVFAHPDDEVLAVGGRLERMAASHVLTLTDGAPRDGRDARSHGFESLEAYREARRNELIAALAHAGLSGGIVLPFPEQVSDQTASFHLVELTNAVAELVSELRPEAVLTHPYEGGHPDHDACAFAVHCAVRLLVEAGADYAPVILEAPSYHAGANGVMRTGAFLPVKGQEVSVIVDLSEVEADNKQWRLACFASQAETLAQFGRDRELFRIAPAYNFTEPPHAGQLLYERFEWGLTGERFRELARAALAQMFPAAWNSLPGNGAQEAPGLL